MKTNEIKIQNLRVCHLTEPLGFAMEKPVFSWIVKGDGDEARAYTLRIRAGGETVFDSGETLSADSLGWSVPLRLRPRTHYDYTISLATADGQRAEASSFFETGKRDEPWTGRWISPAQDRNSALLRKRFFCEKREGAARLYLCGLGVYEVYLNGEKIGEEYLAPGYHAYDFHLAVQTYDVTALLQEGENSLVIALGEGWFKGRLGFEGGYTDLYGDRLYAIAELWQGRLLAATDESWEELRSPVRFANIYDGETWDARIQPEIVGPAELVAPEGCGPLQDRVGLPVVECDRFPVKELIHTPKGDTVLDFGQNLTGWVRFSCDLPEGASISLTAGEILQDGEFYHENYRTAVSRFTYISDGTAREVRPHFTFFGFRYMKVDCDHPVRPEDFTAAHLRSAVPQIVTLNTGSAPVNRLFQNALWGMKDNFLDVPSDCPQRDERLGWTGDAQVFSPTACYQMDTRAFYRKFLKDLRLDQQKHGGAVANYLPNFANGMPGGSSVWGDVASFLPMTLFDCYADRQALSEQYPLMHDWLEWIIRQDEEHGGGRLWNFGFHFGDWLAQDGVTPQSMKGGTDDFFVASMYYFASAEKLARAAQLLGRAGDAERYETLAGEIREAILHEYFAPSGRLCIDTQTAYLLCLNFGVYRDQQIIVDSLKKRLQKDCWKIKGGFVGATMMCRVLAENGMEDLAAYFLFQEGFPGWMHCVNLGATTIWERWNSVLDDGSISGTGMNSLNHYSYGSVMEYVYRDLAGIQSLAPGFQRVRFAPRPTWRLQELEVSYDSLSGVYASYWRINSDGTLTVRFAVPFGCSAQAVLPGCGETVELEAGIFEKTYRPEKDYRLKYSMETRLDELRNDPEAVAILREDLPPAIGLLASGDAEFYSMSLNELQFLFFRGFNPQMVQSGTRRLFELKAF